MEETVDVLDQCLILIKAIEQVYTLAAATARLKGKNTNPGLSTRVVSYRIQMSGRPESPFAHICGRIVTDLIGSRC